MKNLALVISGAVFFVIALVHLYRLIDHFPLIVGDYSVPLWINLIGFLIAGLLSLGMFYVLRDGS